MSIRILTVDDREGIRAFIKDVLESDGYGVDVATDGKDALLQLTKAEYSLMITDLRMPRMDGMALLKESRTRYPNMPVIVLTAHGTIHNAVDAMKMGAVDYLTKPLESPAVLRDIVRSHLPNPGLTAAAARVDKDALVATSKSMVSVLAMLDKVAPTDATVLLTGQSGTGKEVAAARIHAKSNRAGQPFVAVNCAAISPSLMESEMFGHERGAFTGATEQKPGRFELAHNGTLFLDEVGELPLEMQAKLLRVLQEQKFERVGGNASIEVNVRIVAATNRDLQQEIANGAFREDLYHRVSVFPVHLPPLKDRKEDILPLTRHFLVGISKKQNRLLTLTRDAENALLSHHWPGNIRELSNTIERAAILCTPPRIDAADLVFATQTKSSAPSAHGGTEAVSLKDMEKEAILNALKDTDGHRKNAARKLGISLRSLYNKLKEYGID
ncbi:MAG: sigma-54-dependent Fis family transcriptional regulator [Deltaproteobacteria bacterium]|nr:sigma-54-dependent Fis family transcriptional regulator [Deltaproteobacteria bacterium]